MSILNERDYYRIVYGGWLGKNIGGTLGAPVEGCKELLALTFYPKLPDGPLENDDLDLQLVWLHALEQYGPGLTARELGQEWKEHIFFPFDEYGYALTNLRRGLIPPVSGSFQNPFVNCMGSPIRSEIWAMVAPGAPERAAYYAYQDAIVDHAGGEGVYGEMFFAAIESAIFFEKDRDRLIEIGMRHIPRDCRTYKALEGLLHWHSEGKSWMEARAFILKHHGNDNFTDAPQNIAFTILGWLYGESFEDSILKAVNCGYDTDCTAATLGAILGMLLGAEGLPDKWVKPIGDRVVISPPIKGFPAPKDLDELTRRTIRVGKQIAAFWETGVLVLPDQPTAWIPRENRAKTLKELWERPVNANRYFLPQGSAHRPDMELVVDYGPEGPAIGANQRKKLHFEMINRSLVPLVGVISIELPDGWKSQDPHEIRLEPGHTARWEADIRASSQACASSYELALCWTRMHDRSAWATTKVFFSLIGASRWTIWGPGASGTGIEVHFPGNRLDWAKAVAEGNLHEGWHRAETTLVNPSERTIRLIIAANGPVIARLDGRTIIECRQTVEFMPAYHRAPEEQLAELTLPAGIFKLDVEAYGTGDSLQAYVLPVATRNVSEPGANYCFTDIRFG